MYILLVKRHQTEVTQIYCFQVHIGNVLKTALYVQLKMVMQLMIPCVVKIL